MMFTSTFHSNSSASLLKFDACSFIIQHHVPATHNPILPIFRASYHEHLIAAVQGSPPTLRVAPAAMVSMRNPKPLVFVYFSILQPPS